MGRIVLAMMLAGLVGGVALAVDGEKSKAPERFDQLVRVDFFSGFNGDEAALARGLKKCDETLAKDPKHAEALVWRGAGRVFQSAQLFEDQKVAQGLVLWSTGLKDMDEAVALEPKNPGVRIPRAAVLMPAARNAPPAMGKPLLSKALDDFQMIYGQQKDDLDKLSTHAHGELRMGMADVYRMMGELEKSREQLEAVQKEMPGSAYAGRAKEWLAARPEAKLVHECIGCHKN